MNNEEFEENDPYLSIPDFVNNHKIIKVYDPENPEGFPVSRDLALEIAELDENLKTDFCRGSDRRGISFIGFGDTDIKLVDIDNRKYWQVQVKDGDISQIESTRRGGTKFSDGWFTKDELKKLRCLVDVQTGEYTYYPQENLFQGIFGKFFNKEEDEE